MQKRLGTCECEFDECSEYVFDRLTDECPLGNSGPTCALESYIDNSDDIEELFDGDAPEDAVKFTKDIHSSEIRGWCLMKWPSKTLQNLPYFMYKKIHVVFFVFHFVQLWVLPYEY